MQYDRTKILKALRHGVDCNIERKDTCKATFDITPAHKWFIEEVAHDKRITQRQALYDIIQRYHGLCKEYGDLPYKELDEEEYYE